MSFSWQDAHCIEKVSMKALGKKMMTDKHFPRFDHECCGLNVNTFNKIFQKVSLFHKTFSLTYGNLEQKKHCRLVFIYGYFIMPLPTVTKLYIHVHVHIWFEIFKIFTTSTTQFNLSQAAAFTLQLYWKIQIAIDNFAEIFQSFMDNCGTISEKLLLCTDQYDSQQFY